MTLELGDGVACRLRRDSLGERRLADAAELDRLGEGCDGAQFVEGHGPPVSILVCYWCNRLWTSGLLVSRLKCVACPRLPCRIRPAAVRRGAVSLPCRSPHSPWWHPSGCPSACSHRSPPTCTSVKAWPGRR